VIRLPTESWLSGNGLNTILVFLESVLQKRADARIYVEVFAPAVVEALEKQSSAASELGDAVYRKLVFYDAMDFFALLRARGVVLRPQKATCDALQQKLAAFKQERQYMYSSRMLALSPLIDSPREQYGLTARIRTLSSILSHNLRGRIDNDEVEEASNQIMFELVKNIYQHAEINRLNLAAQGYACAQINRHFLFGNDVIPEVLVCSVLEHLRPAIRKKMWKYLSITISDYGVGISNKLTRYFEEKCSAGRKVRVGRFDVDSATAGDHRLMVEIAATTDFSTKTVRRPSDEQWKSGTETVTLAAKGYGLVYCLAFIAKHFGRVNIRSGSVSVSIYPKPDTPLSRDLLQNVGEASSALQECFSEFFLIQPRNLPPEEAHFPGTQILLEIPVEVFDGEPSGERAAE
jgi:hypothetical protein